MELSQKEVNNMIADCKTECGNEADFVLGQKREIKLETCEDIPSKFIKTDSPGSEAGNYGARSICEGVSVQIMAGFIKSEAEDDISRESVLPPCSLSAEANPQFLDPTKSCASSPASPVIVVSKQFAFLQSSSFTPPKEPTDTSPTPQISNSVEKPPKMHQCNLCSKIFVSAELLSKHFTQTHANVHFESGEETSNISGYRNNKVKRRTKSGVHQNKKNSRHLECGELQIKGGEHPFKGGEGQIEGGELQFNGQEKAKTKRRSRKKERRTVKALLKEKPKKGLKCDKLKPVKQPTANKKRGKTEKGLKKGDRESSGAHDRPPPIVGQRVPLDSFYYWCQHCGLLFWDMDLLKEHQQRVSGFNNKDPQYQLMKIPSSAFSVKDSSKRTPVQNAPQLLKQHQQNVSGLHDKDSEYQLMKEPIRSISVTDLSKGAPVQNVPKPPDIPSKKNCDRRIKFGDVKLDEMRPVVILRDCWKAKQERNGASCANDAIQGAGSEKAGNRTSCANDRGPGARKRSFPGSSHQEVPGSCVKQEVPGSSQQKAPKSCCSPSVKLLLHHHIASRPGSCIKQEMLGSSREDPGAGGVMKQNMPGYSMEVPGGSLKKEVPGCSIKHEMPGSHAEVPGGTFKQEMPGSSREDPGCSIKQVHGSSAEFPGGVIKQEVPGFRAEVPGGNWKKEVPGFSSEVSGGSLKQEVPGRNAEVPGSDEFEIAIVIQPENEAKSAESEACDAVWKKTVKTPTPNLVACECKLCSAKFTTEDLLRAHVGRHIEKRISSQRQCSNNHHHKSACSCEKKSRNFICGICKERFKDVVNLWVHKMEKNHYVCFYVCRVCGWKHVSEPLLDDHIKKQHNHIGNSNQDYTFLPEMTDFYLNPSDAEEGLCDPKCYECGLCASRFQKEFLLKYHFECLHGRLGENGSADSVCDICKKRFRTVQDLERHKHKQNHYDSFTGCQIQGSNLTSFRLPGVSEISLPYLIAKVPFK